MMQITVLSRAGATLSENLFVRNLSYMGLSQIVNRMLRLVAAIVVARLLLPEDYGIAALALTVNELVHVLVGGALVNKLVACADDEVEELCNTAYWLNWILCLTLIILQVFIALGMSWYHGKIELGLAIASLSLTYLVLPFGTIQAALTLRKNQLGATAKSETLQTLVDSLFTLIFVLSGWGFWALVLPKIIAAPVWASVYRKAHAWTPNSGPSLKNWRVLFEFGRFIVAGDAIVTLRNNIDYLLVSYFLGLEALGIYFFAFNAGLGITQGFIKAFTTTLYPHLCKSTCHQQRVERYNGTLVAIAAFGIPLVLLQACLSPIYVPFIFGAHWVEAGAIPIVILICISALSRPFADASSQLLRAEGQPRLDLIWQLIFTLALTFALLVGVDWGLVGIAVATLVTHLLLQPIFTYWVITRNKLFMRKSLC